VFAAHHSSARAKNYVLRDPHLPPANLLILGTVMLLEQPSAPVNRQQPTPVRSFVPAPAPGPAITEKNLNPYSRDCIVPPICLGAEGCALCRIWRHRRTPGFENRNRPAANLTAVELRSEKKKKEKDMCEGWVVGKRGGGAAANTRTGGRDSKGNASIPIFYLQSGRRRRTLYGSGVAAVPHVGGRVSRGVAIREVLPVTIK